MERGFSDNRNRCLAVAAFAFFAAASPAFAQAAGSILQSWATGLQRFLTIILGLGALVSMAFAIYNTVNGRQEAAKKIAWIMIAFALGSVLVYAASTYAGGATGNGSGGFDGIKKDLKAILQSALAIVGMITITAHVIQMFHSNEEAYRKVLTWVIGLSVGSAILQAI